MDSKSVRHRASRPVLAALVGLGVLGAASEASAAYVCEIELLVSESASDTASWGRPLSFLVSLHTEPFCGGQALGSTLQVQSSRWPAIATGGKAYDTVLNNAMAEYDDSALVGVFLQLHSAAALGLAVTVDAANDDETAVRFEGVTVSNAAGSPRPAGSSGDHVFDGYVCSSRTQAHRNHAVVFASGHQLEIMLTGSPGCTGGTVHQRTLNPQTESALPDPKKSKSVAELSYRQARLQEFNLATVALGHAMMMAEVGKMQVRVQESVGTGRLDSVRFRATSPDACPPPPKPKPTKPTKPTDKGKPLPSAGSVPKPF